MEVPETIKAKPSTRDEPCPVCSGKVVTVPDPDWWVEVCGQVYDMTYCVSCATIFSPWTLPYWEKVKEAHDQGIKRRPKWTQSQYPRN